MVKATNEEVGLGWWYCPLSSSLPAQLYVITEGAHRYHLELPALEGTTDEGVRHEWRCCPLSFSAFAHLFTIEKLERY